MKARMSPATARQNLPAGTQEAVRAMVDAEFAERQKIYANRILLATCLALNEPERTTVPRPPRRTKSHR